MKELTATAIASMPLLVKTPRSLNGNNNITGVACLLKYFAKTSIYSC